MQEHERKCRVADIASRREGAGAGPIAAHEENRQLIDPNRQLIDPNRQLVRAERVDIGHSDVSHGGTL